MNEHDESAPRARNTRKSRALKRPSRWLEKRSGPMSSRPTAVPGDPPTAQAPAAVAPASVAEPTSFDAHASEFFREGEPPQAEADIADGGEEGGDPALAAAAARRRTFSRHVMRVVALSVVVCVAAFVRSATSASAPLTAAATVVEPLPRVAAAVPSPSPPPPSPPSPPEVAAEVPAEAAPAPARAAREDARRALDRGAAGVAIAAGRHSVELDGTDADAWLILGAAYQLSGNDEAARSAFASCSRLAKRGDVSECRSLLP